MPTLHDLPNECILLVYGGLEDFDHAYRLSRCCRRFHVLFRWSYISIMRSIIIQSMTYSYDIRLCHFIDEIKEYSLGYAEGFEPPTHTRPNGRNFIQCYFANSKNLTDEHVLSIINRWQRFRELRNLYVQSCVLCTPSTATLRYDPIRAEHLQSKEYTSRGTRYSLQGDKQLDGTIEIFNYQQTRRFYKASIAYWLAIEAHHLARVSNYRSEEEKRSVYELLGRLWIDGDERTLLEALDMLEVYIFLYEFLLGKILPDDDASRSWFSGEERRFQWGWNRFVGSCRLHMRPLQIMDLVLHQQAPKSSPWPPSKVKYAGACGIFDREGEVFEGSARTMYDTVFSAGDLERDVELKMRAMGAGGRLDGYANVWACYLKHWGEQSTTTVFWWGKSSEDVLRQLGCYAHQFACLKVHPDFVHLSKRFEESRCRYVDSKYGKGLPSTLRP